MQHAHRLALAAALVGCSNGNKAESEVLKQNEELAKQLATNADRMNAMGEQLAREQARSTDLQKQLEAVPGIKEATVHGLPEREARITLDLEKLALQGISLDRLQDRERLRSAVDQFRRDADHAGQMSGLDSYSQQALGILSDSKLTAALDIAKEDRKIAARYGVDNPEYLRDGAPRMIRNFLIARRLVEAGARVVSLNFSRWDWHGGDGMNFPSAREEFPLLDQGLSALLTDLRQRGLEKDVSVVVWGEFGRTPTINKNAGRDHWPRAMWTLLAGAGVILARHAYNRFAVLVPVDSTFRELSDLKGKRVGMPLGSTTEKFLAVQSARYGLNAADFNVTNLGIDSSGIPSMTSTNTPCGSVR